MLDRVLFETLVAEAALAPSVHNIQPTRWRLSEGGVTVLADSTRTLPVGDPEGRDVVVSHGCAVEGLVLAAGARGLSVRVASTPEGVAALSFEAGGEADPLAALLPRRRTYRGRFQPPTPTTRDLCLALNGPDLTLVDDPTRIADLAALYDEASLRWFRNAAYRAELVSWMRLSRRHPGWARDGLNAQAMEMSGFEAAGAGLVLRPGVFEALDRIGAARTLVAEAPVVRTAGAIALFHRPVGEDPFETGRRFHRLWLGFTEKGLSASPMAVLADDAEASSILAAEFGLGADRRLITAFRLGVAPERRLAPKPRLPFAELIA